MNRLAILVLWSTTVLCSQNATVQCINCTDSAIPGSTWTASYGKPYMIYQITGLEAGVYQLDLTWVEWLYQSTGQRPITVVVNDAIWLKAFDIVKAGGYLNPVTRSTLVSAPGTSITILIANDNGKSAILSGLTLTRVSMTVLASLP